MTPRDAALTYLRAGFSVVPIRRQDKRPLLQWRAYQVRHPSRAEAVSWWKRWPDAGVAIVCGAISGLAVVDFDPRNGDGLSALAGRLPKTLTAETGGGGLHRYFRLAPGERISKIPNLLPGVDLQAEASYVVAPPSLHPSGGVYRWCRGLALGQVPLAPFPPLVRQLVALRRAPELEGEDRPHRPRPQRPSVPTLDAVLSTLRGGRRCGRGWIAHCPAHDDRTPSLSVAERGGTVLLHCFAGCAFEEILAALQEVA